MCISASVAAQSEMGGGGLEGEPERKEIRSTVVMFIEQTVRSASDSVGTERRERA